VAEKIISKIPKTYNPNKVKCLERDHNCCQLCGSKNRLVVHHKDNKGHSQAGKINDRLSNLQTLCWKCHMKVHYELRNPGDNARREVLIKEIMKKRRAGNSFEDIAKTLGVSRQRVHQIYNLRQVK